MYVIYCFIKSKLITCRKFDIFILYLVKIIIQNVKSYNIEIKNNLNQFAINLINVIFVHLINST